MKTDSTNPVMVQAYSDRRVGSTWRKSLAQGLVLVCVVLVPLTGCVTPGPTEQEMAPYSSVKFEEGDALTITFPGSPNLNTTQRVRRDGKIELQLVGEVTALGKTPAELEQELLKLYDKELVLKQVSVTVQSASYPVYVSGSVIRPGKVMADRPMTALEAVMEAGGFDHAKSNMKNVTVVRKEGGQLKHFKLNLKKVLDGSSKQQFYLRPGDIIHVPEKAF